MRGFISALNSYYGLRDYNTATWEGGDAACDHVEKFNRNDGDRQDANGFAGNANREGHAHMGAKQYRDLCGKCGARRIDQQIGLESSPELYVSRLVDVFREVRRVLHPTGTVWLNLGSSYAGGNGNGTVAQTRVNLTADKFTRFQNVTGRIDGYKAKDLIMIPAMVALALQQDGWYLRSEIIWHKKAPMPESVTDRPTKAHEQVFLLAKSQHYYYDADAIREPNGDWNTAKNPTYGEAVEGIILGRKTNPHGGLKEMTPNPAGRNKRSVWTLGANDPLCRLRSDLTPEQRAYVLQRIAAADSLSSSGNAASKT